VGRLEGIIGRAGSGEPNEWPGWVGKLGKQVKRTD
jgi:hypothetical protein